MLKRVSDWGSTWEGGGTVPSAASYDVVEAVEGYDGDEIEGYSISNNLVSMSFIS